MKWEAVAKSVIGVKHIKAEKPCQDYSAYSLEENRQVILGAISDGMGSAEHSDIGSRIAVDLTLKILKNQKVWNLRPEESTLKHFFQNLLQNVINELTKQATNNGYSIEKLACTLIAFVATPKWFSAIQIGDGQIVVSSPKRDYKLIFKPDKGEYANETTPITSKSALREMRFCLNPTCYEFICAATDGIENISLLKTEGWKPYNKFFDGLMESIASSQKSLKEKEEEIEHFLNTEEINRRTDDDKTLLLCSYGNFSLSLDNPETTDPIPEEVMQFVSEIKTQLAEIPEAEDVYPKLAIRKKTLEITFITEESLKYPRSLFERVRDFFADNDCITIPANIEKVMFYAKNRNTSRFYFREEFRLKKSLFNFDRISLLFIIFLSGFCLYAFFLLSSIIFGAKKVDKDPNSTKSPSPATTQVTPLNKQSIPKSPQQPNISPRSDEN
jgi:serine/threonine protein phosphatase PrpC